MRRTWLCLSVAAALIGLVAYAHAQRSMSGMGITLTGRSGGATAGGGGGGCSHSIDLSQVCNSYFLAFMRF